LEKLHIKLGLSGTYWDRRPEYEIIFNGTTITAGAITGASGDIEYIDFDVEYTTESAKLEIKLLNKIEYDTVQSEDKTSILNDMLLNIELVEIDEINLKQVLRNVCEYTPDTPVTWQGETTQLVKNCINLGWNGTWNLTWTAPFYVWLLENM